MGCTIIDTTFTPLYLSNKSAVARHLCQIRNQLFIAFLCNLKSFAITKFFLLSVAIFGRTGKGYFHIFLQLLLLSMCNQDRSYKYDIPCSFKSFPVEIPCKQKHLASSSSTTKINIFPLPQCLWPYNLTGWWLTMRSSHP